MQVIITTELTEEWSEDPDTDDDVFIYELNIKLETPVDGKTIVHIGQISQSTKKCVQEWFFKRGLSVPMWVADRIDFEANLICERQYLYDTETDILWRKV